MNDKENVKVGNNTSSEEQKKSKEKPKKPVRKTQGQMLQESLGLSSIDMENIENKLYLARFLDYISTETFDFVFKDRGIEQYKTQITNRIEGFGQGQEEDKLLKQSFENKQVFKIIYQLKSKAEELARNKGIKEPFDKKMRKYSLLITLPMFGVLILLTFLGTEILFLFPLLCLFCFLPQLIRGAVVKKWYRFKEENRTQFYTENREDILIIKGFTGEILNNIRSKLIELRVPLKLITFPLYSEDYENLQLKSKRPTRGGLTQYLFCFEYPEGMEPFPVPETLQQYEQLPVPEGKKHEKPEKNFIILTEMKGKNGIIESFVPNLKEALADKINNVLNNCEFEKISEDFNAIIPGYSSEMAIYCLCGDIAEIDNIQICNWKNMFKFYLFEAKSCKCGEQVFALSLMDEKNYTDIPEELKDIFSS